jgi:hypothetical protein
MVWRHRGQQSARARIAKMLITRCFLAACLFMSQASMTSSEATLNRQDPILAVVAPETNLPRHPNIFPDPGPVSPLIQGIAFALVPQIKPFELGKSMYIGQYFVNKTRYRYSYDTTKIIYRVSGSGAEVHPYSPIGDSPTFGEVFDRQEIFPSGTSLNEADITHFVKFMAPGTYQIEATIHISDTNITLTSPAISITVIPPVYDPNATGCQLIISPVTHLKRWHCARGLK